MGSKSAENSNGVSEVKRKKRPHEYSPVIGTNGFNITPDDANKITNVTLRLIDLPKIDVNDPVAVRERLKEYFKIYSDYALKPTVAGMASALGYDRHWLYSVVNGIPAGGKGNKTNLNPECTHIIKKCFRVLEEQWENYMLNGKINPVSGIFFGKNHYKYQDRLDYAVSATKIEEEYSAEDIRSRYMIDSRTGRND